MMKNIIKPALLAVMLAFISGCGASLNSDGVNETSGSVINGQGDESIQMDLKTTVDAIQEENSLHIDIHFANQGDKPLELFFASGQQFEIIITNEKGEEVYRYSDDRMFTMALQFITLQAGEAFQWQDEWNLRHDGQAVPSGLYIMTVEILAQSEVVDKALLEEMLSAQLAIEIEGHDMNEQPVGSSVLELENNAFRKIEVEGSNGEYTITGEARVFEATLKYRVTDGHVYFIEDFHTASDGGPNWGTFLLEIMIAEEDLPVNGTLTLELYEESAKDGSEINVLIIPIETFGQ
jgi:hypothetical protein